MTSSGPAAAVGLGQGTGRRFGSGWISGILAVTCAALGYGGVLCLLFPDWLVAPSTRAHYPLALVPDGYWSQLAWPFRGRTAS